MSELKYYKLFPDVEDPVIATKKSACFDLKVYLKNIEYCEAYSAHGEKYKLKLKKDPETKLPLLQIPPMDRVMVPTGLIFDIPENHVMKVYPRSSVGFKKGICLANGTGIIDEDYVDPLYLLVINLHMTKYAFISHGERICQAELVPVIGYNFVPVSERPNRKSDRDGGIGSTGA